MRTRTATGLGRVVPQARPFAFVPNHSELLLGSEQRLISKWIRVFAIGVAAFGFLIGPNVIGQERRPAIGFQKANSYSISDIENVNLTNGNLMLNIPLASLPGRGSAPGYSVGLNYNSKLWNARRERRTDGIGEEIEGLIYYRELVELSGQGGWFLDTGGYLLRLINRLDLEGEAPCTVASGEAAYHRNAYQSKLEMQLPDGSIKAFIPFGYDYDTAGNSDLDPYGVRHSYSYAPPQEPSTLPSCSQSTTQVTTAGINYVTDDGSNLRLFLPYQSGVAVPLMRWTLYFPDGRVLEHKPTDDSSAIHRLTDRNGNKMYWREATINGYAGVKIENEVGQYVFVGENAGVYKIIQPGVSGNLSETTLHWTAVYVYHNYRATDAANANSGQLFTDLFETLWMLDSITLPTQAGGLEYSFAYNGATSSPGNYTDGWGQLKSITMPSGAKAEYSYGLDDNNTELQAFDAVGNSVTGRVLTYQTHYDGGTQEVTEPTVYATGPGVGSVSTPDGRSQSQTAANGGDQTGMVYHSAQTGGSLVEKIWVDKKLAVGSSGSYVKISPFVKTEFTTIPDASGTSSLTAAKDFDYDQNGNVLEVREYDWVPYSSVPRASTGAVDEYLPVPRPTGLPSGLVLKRKTVNTYYNPTPNATAQEAYGANYFANTSAPGLTSILKSTEVQDGSGNVKARSEFFYDNPSTTGNLVETRIWDSHKGALASPDGNGSKLNSSNSISTTTAYDSYGNPTVVTDAKGVQTTITYGAVSGPNGNVTGLYPTMKETASNYSTVKRTSGAVYDFYTGVVTTATDVDNDLSVVNEYDDLGRITKVRSAANTDLEVWTATEYDDVNRRVIVRSDVATKGDGKHVTTQFYDQLGRVRLAKTLEDATTQSATNETDGIKVETRYLTGSPYSYQITSNPFRAAHSTQATDEASMGWTRSLAINNGLHSELETFSGAALPAPWGNNTNSTGVVETDRDANTTIANNEPGVVATVTDQAGRLRRSITNSLGQLVRVDEPNGSNSLGTVAAPNQATKYTYDVLNNLLTVVQAGNSTEQCGGSSSCSQTRTFTYSSLSRLLAAENPESGTITYTYDDNGNLTQKTDARSVTTTYGYDALNRATTRSYSGGTPTVTYTYDAGTGVTYAKGKLISVSSNVSTYSYSGYDVLGRATGVAQTLGGQSYELGYSYDLAGHVISMTYPSGRTVTNTYDGAGRLNDVSGELGDGTSRTYSTGILYDAAARLIKEQFGTDTPIYNKLRYNSRGQLAEILESTSYTGSTDTTWNRGKIVNDYECTGSCNGPENNGNLRKQTVSVPNNEGNTSATSWYQQYDYDSLNRLQRVHEYTGNTSLDWQQEFVYDRFGNRTIHQSNTFGSGVPKPNFTVNAANNRLGVPSGQTGTMTYDSAGNLTVDTYSAGAVTRVYDAENRMTADTEGDNTNEYSYDGDGRRVKRYVATDDAETWQVYGLGGELLAEYDAENNDPSTPQKEYGYRNGQLLITADGERIRQRAERNVPICLACPNPPSDRSFQWLVSDQLGTPRMTFDQSGDLAGISRHDYLPFGEELTTETGQRGSTSGYDAADGVRQQFTSKERDNETGLDYFEARYYASPQGRFASADPIALTVGRLYDPQQINLYAYCRNNPLAFIDPLGETIDFANKDARNDYEEYEKFLNKDPKKYASELATLKQLQDSDVTYVIKLGGSTDFSNGTEGRVTTDGKSVFVNMANEGNGREKFSLNSRFGHELEHARQFDSGEFGFAFDKNGKFAGYVGLDISEEVKAWQVGSKLASAGDYQVKGGSSIPELQFRVLAEFGKAKTDDERAGVLARISNTYKKDTENGVPYGTNFTVQGTKPGTLIRPADRTFNNGTVRLFGRTHQ